MRSKKMLLGASVAMLSALLLVGCGPNAQKKDEAKDDKTTITFWAAPNPTQLKYWEEIASEFEKDNPDIKVEVSQMKESPSSEATIQSAIASKTAPTLSENINRSFAAQLADSEAILPFNETEQFSEIVSKRKMETSIKGWEFSDGNQYVLPMYSNPILFAWRTDILKEAGVNEVPKTYSDLIEAGEKVSKSNKDIAMWAKKDLADPTAWMRWFDFFPLYNAASSGAAFVEDGKYVADDKAVEEALGLINTLNKNKFLRTGEATEPFENGDSFMADLGPWTFPNWTEKYPDMKFDETYTVTAPVVPDSMANEENIATYADAKGIVMYAQATESEQKAAMKFLDFIYSDEKNDLKWLEVTSLIPARDDAMDNETFKAYFEENPQMKVFAEYVPYAVPAMDNEKYNDIQQAFGEKAWVPSVRGEKDSKSAAADGKKAVEEVLQ